ncbi:MAG: hypothetical protein R2851_02685 [Caldilineaceae bacterium]
MGTLHAGALMLGVPATPAGNEAAADGTGAVSIGLLAVGDSDTRLSKLDANWLDAQAAADASRAQVAAGLDAWVAAVTAVLGSAFPPNDATPLQAGQTVQLDKDKAARPDAPVVWVHQSDGHSKIGGTLALPELAGDQWIPLAEQGDVFDVWLQAESAVNLATWPRPMPSRRCRRPRWWSPCMPRCRPLAAQPRRPWPR